MRKVMASASRSTRGDLPDVNVWLGLLNPQHFHHNESGLGWQVKGELPNLGMTAASRGKPPGVAHAKAVRPDHGSLVPLPAYLATIPAIAFTSKYSSKPTRPHSRPLPDCL